MMKRKNNGKSITVQFIQVMNIIEYQFTNLPMVSQMLGISKLPQFLGSAATCWSTGIQRQVPSFSPTS